MREVMNHLLIIGGSDAGISAALRAREVNPDWEATVLVADAYPNFSICGLPFFLSGETPDWHDLAHRTAAEIEAQGIRLALNHTARVIDPGRRIVIAQTAAGDTVTLPYDRLVIATGAEPLPPAITGYDLPGVYPLHTMDDSFRVERHLRALLERARDAAGSDAPDQRPRALIIGGGYIGLEMADALVHRGCAVTLAQRGPTVLTSVEPQFGALVAQELERHGVEVVTEAVIERLTPDEEAPGRLVAVGRRRAQGLESHQGHPDIQAFHAFQRAADLIVVATGVRPVTALAQRAGVALGAHGAIQVNRAMETNVPYVYAAGDCVETWHHTLQAATYLPLGTTAHKQGRIAAENAVCADGGHSEFAGSLGTQVVKVFDLAIARTGLLEVEALAAGFMPLTVETTTWDHKRYYPGAQEVRLRVTGDRVTGRLLGAQIIGDWRGEVAKRIDIFATALFHGMRVADISDLDLSYTPPLSSPWDPVQMAAQAWERKLRHTNGMFI